MISRSDWMGALPVLVIGVGAILLTVWQVRIDRSVFEPYFGALNPIAVMTGATLGGTVVMAYLHHASTFEAYGPGSSVAALTAIAWAVPLLTAVAIAADLVFRFDEDMNVAMPDALRFYAAIAVFVEIVLHVVPIAALVAVLGPPTGLDASFWRVAIPVALIEAGLQAAYASAVGTAVFSGVHLVVFGVIQVWMFWRYGFVWMLGFRLAYYSLWHLAWGAARLGLLF